MFNIAIQTYPFRVSECKYWTNINCRHCNSYRYNKKIKAASRAWDELRYRPLGSIYNTYVCPSELIKKAKQPQAPVRPRIQSIWEREAAAARARREARRRAEARNQNR